MEQGNFHIEVDIQQAVPVDNLICGDVFFSERIKSERRLIMVLSDGMGTGVKANVLATLTASMALNFIKGHRNIRQTAEIIMDTLPVCSVRGVSYSTFTIIDIEFDGTTNIIEYDNPASIVMRGKKPFDPDWREIVLESEKHKGKILRLCKFQAQKEDRIFFWSDGIAQSGMGSRQYPFGWGEENVEKFVHNLIERDLYISASAAAKKIIDVAIRNDNNILQDDTSCAVVYFRQPRRLLICTGPPYDRENDSKMAVKLQSFEGKKIISGGTTAEILAMSLNLLYRPGMEMVDPDLPPISYMEGVNLVTEGVLTLSKVATLLREYTLDTVLGNGPADEMIKLIFKSDFIHFLVGTSINTAHQDPTLPQELEIRRSIVRRIVETLEQKYLKEVSIEFI
ncbi:MAG: SpoIIE family protein phosphatase [Bacteroidales bacterium]|nr:SpoIIE family protein phosphatase [Bacteroidales bacterium]MDY0216746.1 SpoIIE family protein phosphatase [Bacteroidales bacterium]